MTLHFSKPPLCRTGHSRGDRYSPAWEQADTVVALYRAKDGHKTIAKQLGISPRIAREILIERGEWNPGELRRPQIEARRSRDIALHIGRMEKRVRRCINKPPPKPANKFKGMTWMERYNADPQKKTIHLLRKRMRRVLQRGDKSASTIALLGCTREEFVAHMESKFRKGMTWSNLGIGRGKWNIDHIIPCASFDMTDPAHQRRCFHYTNMQPLWAIDNLIKHDTTPDQHQWSML